MDLKADARLPFPRDLVFRTYRDDILKMLPFLPNVRNIEVKSREDEGPVTRFVNLWHGGGEIPAAARAFLSDAMLSWTDRASWNSEELTCDWTIETHAFTEAVSCHGHNRFLDDGNGTLLEIRGTLTIDAKKIRGVPSLLAGKVGRSIEEFLAKRIEPNLIETAKGLERYLQEQQGK